MYYYRAKIYNIVIIGIYCISCFIIFNNQQQKVTYTNTNVKNSISTNIYIIGSIMIDKINLKKPLYKIESNHNKVDENVTILKSSTLPDQEQSILIIAAHSGTSHISYFERLDELTENDIIKIHYQNKDYFYQVTSIWEEDKTGYIHINKKKEKQLILTTCSPKHEGKQLIVNSILI